MRFPRRDSYVARLPQGLASHPQCKARASLYRQSLERHPFLPSAAAALPPELKALLDRPMPYSAWIPEAWSMGVMLATMDMLELDHPRAVEWSKQANRAIYSGSIFRVLMAMLSPEALLQGAQMRWSKMHEGWNLEVLPATEAQERGLKLTFAARLLDQACADSFAAAFEVALEFARAKSPTVCVEALDDLSCTMLARWT